VILIQHRGTYWIALLFAVAGCSANARAPDGQASEVSASDVHHFVDAYKRLTPSDSACAPLAEYLRQESRGLKAYRKKFGVGQADICAAVRQWPARYDVLESKLPALDSAEGQIRTLFAKFSELHPIGRMPSVYFLVGNHISGGTTTGGSDPTILIGMEVNGSVKGLPGMIAHELVHTQQHYPLMGAMTGGPKFLRGSLLRHAIKEGSANFIAELLTDEPVRDAFGEAHEAELWQEFKRDAHSKDWSRWLYNGWNKKALGDRPVDIGYWVGYRITKSYYENAPDKQQAIREILSIKDFDRFLESSHYTGGVGSTTRAQGR
jgi:hypothetical protein